VVQHAHYLALLQLLLIIAQQQPQVQLHTVVPHLSPLVLPQALSPQLVALLPSQPIVLLVPILPPELVQLHAHNAPQVSGLVQEHVLPILLVVLLPHRPQLVQLLKWVSIWLQSVLMQQLLVQLVTHVHQVFADQV